jgi:hypothetical protein
LYKGDKKVCDAIDKNRENVKVYTIPNADHDNADYLANGALDRMKECVRDFKYQGEAAGDVVYGRPVGK